MGEDLLKTEEKWMLKFLRFGNKKNGLWYEKYGKIGGYEIKKLKSLIQENKL